MTEKEKMVPHKVKIIAHFMKTNRILSFYKEMTSTKSVCTVIPSKSTKTKNFQKLKLNWKKKEKKKDKFKIFSPLKIRCCYLSDS